MNKTLICWIGHADLKCARGEEDGLGPIGQAVKVCEYGSIELIADQPKKDKAAFQADIADYVKWLAERTKSRIAVHQVKLSSPMHFGEVFLYPQKALANDQLLKLREMAAAIPCISRVHADHPLLVSRYDGSVDSSDRPQIREQVQLMLTNPDMLHFSVLQHHENHWARFFRNLKLVAIDECHEYRGIFGTNVALILHRLRQICLHYGSNPTFIATSATVSEPQAHMQKLTGLPFECIDSVQDGSQQGERKIWMASQQT